jgi:HSP20 family protein
MLVRSDPFRQFDRLAEQVYGTIARPAAMPMDAWRDGNEFVVEFDLPGIDPASIDLDVERNVLTVRAERQPRTGPEVELVASERPRGVFSRQVILGDALDTGAITAAYSSGVLRLTIPVATDEHAAGSTAGDSQVISATAEDRQPVSV